MKHIKALFVILFVLLVIIISVENIPGLKTPVVFRIDLGFFDFQTPDIPLATVAVITFLIGVLAMGLFGMVERFRLKKQIKTLLREAAEREKELDSLRSLSNPMGLSGPEQETEGE